ncbi:MAG: heat-inducible transcriptional repressor HrcA [Vicinamibacteraceae bacterium]
MPHSPRYAAPELSDRVLRLLGALVREYIEHGEPVSSQWLAGHGGCAVSSATVRNVLARLEEQGYVKQPHTSAGRVPTDLGYRQYVDGLVQGRRPSRSAPEVEARLRQGGTVPEVLAHASHELTRQTQHVGFAWAPAAERLLQRIEFVPLDAGRVLVVVVAMNGEVAHKVVPFAGPATREQLIEAANYLTAQYGALSLTDIRARLLEEMQAERALYDELFARTLALAQETLASLPGESHVFVSGAPTIADLGLSPEALPTLRALLAMLEEKDRLSRLLTAYLEDSGLTIVIGTEHLSPDLQSLSLVLTTCSDGARIGIVGILGPTRMRYSRAIAAVDSVSHAMSRVFAS